MPQEDVFELTAAVTVVLEDSADSFEFQPTTFEPSEEPVEELPLDAAQYPGIDFSIAPEQRNEHTPAEIWKAWYEGALASPETSGYSSVEMIEHVYRLGLDSMS